MKQRRIDWKRSWYRLPFIPFRVLTLGVAYFVLLPLATGLEILGSYIPGLKDK